MFSIVELFMLTRDDDDGMLPQYIRSIWSAPPLLLITLYFVGLCLFAGLLLAAMIRAGNPQAVDTKIKVAALWIVCTGAVALWPLTGIVLLVFMKMKGKKP